VEFFSSSIPYAETGYFTKFIADYTRLNAVATSFYDYLPTDAGLDEAINNRANHPIDREVLVSTLERQYEHINKSEKTATNINLLKNQNTYTVCTAHQPNLMTGYLYFTYKIIHAIKLCHHLKSRYPEKDFVPVYYMGSEDQDIDELGVFNFRGDEYRWDGNGQKGAVGRMKTESLQPLFAKMLHYLGSPGATTTRLKEIIEKSYLQQPTIAAATLVLVNELFGQFGLVVLNPDQPEFKKKFQPIIEDELFNNVSYKLVSERTVSFEKHYKSQAFPRPINLFYLDNNCRERIEFSGKEWRVLNTEIAWNQNQLSNEISAHPEKFSPNVILRPLYQETILPNVAFIGGGAEVTYWGQLKPLFHNYKIFLPAVILRQSLLTINNKQNILLNKLHLQPTQLFQTIQQLQNNFIMEHAHAATSLETEFEEIKKIAGSIQIKAKAVDTTLELSVKAAAVKIEKTLLSIQKKLIKSEKKKMAVAMDQIEKIKSELFPKNSLQERTDNFPEYFLEYGNEYFTQIFNHTDPINREMKILTAKDK
jgi:bacillithiol synthase